MLLKDKSEVVHVTGGVEFGQFVGDKEEYKERFYRKIIMVCCESYGEYIFVNAKEWDCDGSYLRTKLSSPYGTFFTTLNSPSSAK